jgi:putative hydrolase of the HAD superfamily
VTYAQMLERWSEVTTRLDAASAVDDHEFSMHDAAQAFLVDLVADVDPSAVDGFVATYLAEWNRSVVPVVGAADLVLALARRHRLAVVTNTHDPGLVPAHLDSMGIATCFAAVITSVEVGWRKPHPAIYRAALEALDTSASRCTFVGDTQEADYDGPRANGMQALLIDPGGGSTVPSADRLGSVLDLADRFEV